jgi:hypothetical protein
MTMRGGALVVTTWVAVVTVAALAVGQAIGFDTVVRSIVIFFPGVFGVWAGARLFARSTDAIYRRVALTLLLAAGVAAMVA